MPPDAVEPPRLSATVGPEVSLTFHDVNRYGVRAGVGVDLIPGATLWAEHAQSPNLGAADLSPRMRTAAANGPMLTSRVTQRTTLLLDLVPLQSERGAATVRLHARAGVGWLRSRDGFDGPDGVDPGREIAWHPLATWGVGAGIGRDAWSVDLRVDQTLHVEGVAAYGDYELPAIPTTRTWCMLGFTWSSR